MAWSFNGVNNNVKLADNAALTFPNADWTVSLLVELVSPATGATQVMFDWADGSAECWFVVTNNAGNADEINLYLADDGYTNEVDRTSTASPFMSNTSWTSVILQRSGSNYLVFVNNTEVINSAGLFSVGAINVAGTFNFGYYESEGNRWLKGALAEFAKWDRALNSTERGKLWNGTKGLCPRDPSINTNLVVYVPMGSGDYTEKIAGIAVTNNGTTGATHPPIYYEKSVAGAFTFSGAVQRTIAKPLSGVFTFAGNLIKTIKGSPLTGAFTFSGALNMTVRTKVIQDLSGTFTFTGNLLKTIKPPTLTGVLTFTGELPKLIKKILTGILEFSGAVDPQPDIPPVPVGENLLSCDATADKYYKHDGFTTTITDSFAAPSTIPVGLVWMRTGEDIVTSDAAANKIYVHAGFTTTVSSSYAHAHGASLRNISCDVLDNIYVAGSGATDKLYKMAGITSTITSSIASPGTDPRGISWGRGGNLYTSDNGASKYYKHSGFTTTITSSFTQAWTNDGMCVNPGLGVIDVSIANDKIVRMINGFSSTVNDSIASPGGDPRGVDWETRLKLTLTQNNAGAFTFAGALDTTVRTKVIQVVAGVFSFTGSLTALAFTVITQNLTGALTFSGVLSRTIVKKVAGSFTMSGALSYFVYIPNRLYRKIKATFRIIMKD